MTRRASPRNDPSINADHRFARLAGHAARADLLPPAGAHGEARVETGGAIARFTDFAIAFATIYWLL